MDEFEIIKKEWMACAKFIRAKYTLKYPQDFENTIESRIEEHLKSRPLLLRFQEPRSIKRAVGHLSKR